jgi:hypothetical protein
MARDNRLGEGIVLTISAEPIGDLRGGPLRLLLQLRQLAGHSRRLVTYTKSLATLFDRCVNTIRAWRTELVKKGYVHATTCARTGTTTYLITERVEPPSRRNHIAEQRRIDALPEPLPWQPKKPKVMKDDPAPWWQWPDVVDWRANSKASQGGAQKSAPIKASKNIGEGRGGMPPRPLVDRAALAVKWGL